MLTLHLGVIDIPYSDASYTAAPKDRKIGRARRGKITAPAPQSNHKTTGDVAEILEAKYHIMETFFETHEDAISGLLEKSVEGALQNLLAGPGTLNATAEGESDIAKAFQDFIEQRGMDGLVDGVPTKAAQRGVSHRFLHPYAKRPSRPSFVDTGLYVANFAAWTTD